MLSRAKPSVLMLGFIGIFGCSTSPSTPATGQGGSSGGSTGSTGSGGVSTTGAGGNPTTTGAGGSQPVDAGGGSGGSTGAGGNPGTDAGRDATTGGDTGGVIIGDPGTMGDGNITVGPNYTTQIDLTDRGNPKGRAFMFTMNSTDSTLYKGTDTTLLAANQHSFTRRIDVYVPAQYKAGTPAPVLVIHDGPGELSMVRNALDNLTISTDPMRKLPAFVAVAVANGGGDSKGSERGLEYDTMSDRFARFIQTEVFPAVLNNAQIKAAYPTLTFTDNPEGKATMGCSSGGAAALTMGWFRPDLFRRIITYSGTFVDQQDDDAAEEAMFPLGAWDYHSGLMLIANNPVKPLRMVINANEMDNGATAAESGHHNWVLANQRTAAALMAKGYHYRYIFGQAAGHCAGQVRSATLADSLVWVWRGYPAP